MSKAKISCTMDEELLKRLDNFRKENHNVKRSTVIEEAARKFLDEKKGGGNK